MLTVLAVLLSLSLSGEISSSAASPPQSLPMAFLTNSGFICFFPVQAGTCPDYSRHASLHHCVAMALLSRLLPGSEHLAYEILLDLAFNPEFLP